MDIQTVKSLIMYPKFILEMAKILFAIKKEKKSQCTNRNPTISPFASQNLRKNERKHRVAGKSYYCHKLKKHRTLQKQKETLSVAFC